MYWKKAKMGLRGLDRDYVVFWYGMVLCGEWEENLRVMIRRLDEIHVRRGM